MTSFRDYDASCRWRYQDKLRAELAEAKKLLTDLGDDRPSERIRLRGRIDKLNERLSESLEEETP